jgi:tRNA pseudouridine13 synthase
MQDKDGLDLSLPYITETIKGIGGTIRETPIDFQVEEIPLYEPSGNGNHLYINITKTNKTTREVQLELARLFELKPEAIGKAGLKDKYAVTTQTFSVIFQNSNPLPSEVVNTIENTLDVKVNWARYHNNKLRAGHLIGNKFIVNITSLEIPIPEAFNRAVKIAAFIHNSGLPNYYGEQRIGAEGSNVLSGLEILKGKKRVNDRWLRKYLISSYQSYLCNKYLSERVNKGLFNRVIKGDIAKKHDTGGIFWVEDVCLEQPRFEAKEISFTAPIFGYKMASSKDEAAKLEEEILLESSINIETFREHGVKGTRRLGRLLPHIEVREISKGIQLVFSLPKGGFATTLLREFTRDTDFS